LRSIKSNDKNQFTKGPRTGHVADRYNDSKAEPDAKVTIKATAKLFQAKAWRVTAAVRSPEKEKE
jgi:hypothetical protein